MQTNTRNKMIVISKNKADASARRKKRLRKKRAYFAESDLTTKGGSELCQDKLA